MERKNKIDLLNAMMAGKASVYNLIAAQKWFVKIGAFWISGSYRYTQEQFEKIKKVMDNEGVKPEGIICSLESDVLRNWVIKNTKSFQQVENIN